MKIEFIKGDAVKLVEKDSKLIEILKLDGWKPKVAKSKKTKK